MFANFHKKVEADPARTWIWEALHYPLHFCVLALIGAMTNCIIVNVWSRGLLFSYRLFGRALTDIRAGQLSAERVRSLALTFDRLKLNPDFETEYERLVQPGQTSAAVTVKAYQYFAQIIHGTCSVSRCVYPALTIANWSALELGSKQAPEQGAGSRQQSDTRRRNGG